MKTNIDMLVQQAGSAQTRAADPQRSTWVSANAGSGKTRVLTNRAARLLYQGVPPNKIVCLTYTQAAAQEMQNRLFAMLGEWAMADDDDLRVILSTLQGEDTGLDDQAATAVTPKAIARARRLFAQALETPGGLQIQTIHAFCASILRKFPIEANVPPEFKSLEGQEELALQRQVFEKELLQNPEFKNLFEDLVPYFSMSRFPEILSEFLTGRTKFDGINDPDSLYQHLLRLCNLSDKGEDTRTAILTQWYKSIDFEALERLLPLYKSVNGPNALKAATALENCLKQEDALDVYLALEPYFLTTSFTPRASLLPASIKKIWPEAVDMTAAWQETYCKTRLKLDMIHATQASHILYQWISILLAAYQREKRKMGALDFTDQILTTRDLLVHADIKDWVRYKLDGGIEHLLVDEAQDTSPEQWEVIRAITDDFFDGDSILPSGHRTIFAVGDEKQSIYSFQGANPQEFAQQGHIFKNKAGISFQNQPLIYSFRSSATILRFIDTVFQDKASKGLTFSEQTIQHVAARNLSGYVDIWPLLEADKEDQVIPPFWEPKALAPTTKPRIRLARTLAAEIERMLTDPTVTFPDEPDKRVQAGDILVLVRSRDVLQQELIRCLKRRNIPVAGADRLQLTEELIVKDLMALARWCLMPDDDLRLAAVLRSPLCNVSEEQLYSAAYARKSTLWQAIRNSNDMPVIIQSAIDFLQDMLNHADFERPFEFFSRALFKHNLKPLFIKRLGHEVVDALDAFLDQCLAFEKTHPPALEGFCAWMRDNTLSIKRALPVEAGQVRIMTVHGAKGLEAPIVILPDVIQPPERPTQTPQIMRTALDADTNIPVWTKVFSKKGLGAHVDVISQTYKVQEQAAIEENKRLLYVAMTRAERWLIICGHMNASKPIPKDSWWPLIEQRYAMNEIKISHPGFKDSNTWAPSEISRLQSRTNTTKENITTATLTAATTTSLSAAMNVPAYMYEKPAFEQRSSVPVSPSSTKMDESTSPDTTIVSNGLNHKDALAYGTLVHYLLETETPDMMTANTYCCHQELDLSKGLQQTACEEVKGVLNAPDLAYLFEHESMSEIDIAGHINNTPYFGRIDRIVIDNTRNTVWIIDYKTGSRPKVSPPSYHHQLEIYATLVKQVYPDKTVIAGIVWTSPLHLAFEEITSLQ